MIDDTGSHCAKLNREDFRRFNCTNALLITKISQIVLVSFNWSHTTQRDSLSDFDPNIHRPAERLR